MGGVCAVLESEPFWQWVVCVAWERALFAMGGVCGIVKGPFGNGGCVCGIGK